MRNSISIFLLLLMSFLTAHASKVKFYNINDINGIPVREIYSLCKDPDGFVWASAKSGIIRVSGTHGRFYKLPYKMTDYVMVKLAINGADLFAYSNTGDIAQYNNIQDRFDVLLNLRSLTKNNQLLVKQMVVDSRNALWIATSAGLYKYVNDRLMLIDKKKYGVDFVALYNNISIFYASFEGLYLIDSESGQKKTMYANRDFHYQVTAFHYAKKSKKIWLGTDASGLLCYDEQEKELDRVPSSSIPRQPILAVVGSSDNLLLIGIDGQGVWSFDGNRQRTVSVYREDLNDPYSLKGDGVHDILCGDGRTWVATYTGGISYFENESPFIRQISYQSYNPNSLVNNSINKIFEDKDECLWFATHNGLSRWNPKTNIWNNYYKDAKNHSKLFLAISQDANGNIWVGSFSSGAFVLNSSSGQEIKHYSSHFNIPNFKNDDVLDMFTDSEGDVWIGGNQDLTCYFIKENKFRSYGIQPVNSFAEFTKGRLLLTTSRGLALLDKKSGTISHLFDGSLAQDVLVIGNEIWVATSGNGLIKYDFSKKTTKQYSTESGLPSNYINSIVSKGNNIWIGTELGLCRINIITDKIETYTSNRILSNASFNVNAALLLKNGNIVMGTKNNGAIIFDPNLIRETTPKGNIYFQDILVSGYSIRNDEKLSLDTPINREKKLTLSYNQNNFSLELIPVGTSSDKTKFSWKLEGVDKGWSQPVAVEYITYQNLPSGTFQLKIRMFDDPHSQVISERNLDIQVIPPFWDRWWFKMLMSLLIVGLLFLLFRIYNDRIQQRHAKEKLRFFTNTSHEMRTSLTLIKAPIEELSKSPELSDNSRYYLKLATEQTSKLNQVANQLLDLQKMDVGKEILSLSMSDVVHLVRQRINMAETSALRRGIDVKFRPDMDSYFSAIDEIKIEKVVDNLISNAIKYSHENSEIIVWLKCSSDRWMLEVKDFGIGISEKGKTKLFKEFYRGENAVNTKAIGSGIGLLLIKEYAEMHGGRVSYESKSGEGSIFYVSIPHRNVPATNHLSKVSRREDDMILPLVQDLVLSDEDESILAPMPNLLFVEDNEELQNFMRMALRDNYRLRVASDGREAWEIVGEQQPDLIVSDIMMPNMDGIELCKLIKSTYDTAHIPVILLTALSDKSKELEALGLGADDYITKPFDISILQSRIGSIIANRKIVRETALHNAINEDDERNIVKNRLNDQFIRQALEVVNRNMENNEFGRDDFASEMCVSPSLLYKKMKALTGQSPSDFIKSVRMNYAQELLQSGKYSVTEVGDKVGFSSLSIFSRAFKSYFGKAPTDL